MRENGAALIDVRFPLKKKIYLSCLLFLMYFIFRIIIIIIIFVKATNKKKRFFIYFDFKVVRYARVPCEARSFYLFDSFFSLFCFFACRYVSVRFYFFYRSVSLYLCNYPFVSMRFLRVFTPIETLLTRCSFLSAYTE